MTTSTDDPDIGDLLEDLDDIRELLPPFRLAGVSGLYVRRSLPVAVPPVLPPIPAIAGGADGELELADASATGGLDGDGSADAGDSAEAMLPIHLRVGGELRLDVDGRYPLMVASGTLTSGLFQRVHWIARLRRAAPRVWTGPIFYRDGMVNFAPYTNVRITVVQPSPFRPPRSATVRFTRAGGPGLTLHYTFRSAYAHDVEMEYDCATGVTPVTTFDVGSHPNRPATLPSSTISIERVFERAGFRVSRSNGDNIVPLAGAGANALWSDAEMHDAMQTYWSRFANVPQWAVWTFFAALSDQGTGLGGIMFDDIGPSHRQGTAVFEDSFISTPPAGDPNGAAAVARMRFWTAVHELGHTFNLAHSWQKTLSIGTRGPWIPLVDNNEARSFMSYPFRVSGGPTAFFSDFEYRFGDDELLFMRHAPSRFVQQGNAAWFDHHGFSQAEVSAEPALRLELRVHRDDWQGIPTFGFLEPVYIEMKLTNVSLQPQLVDEHLLLDRSAMAVVVKREGKEAQLRLPMAAYCNVPSIIALEPGASLYESMLASVTKGGWMIDEPGRYLVQVALELPTGEHLVSNPLTIRVAPPKQVEHERLASDYLTEDVARIYSFGGSRVLKAGNEALQEVAARMGDEPVARHAHLMLGRPLADDFKLLKMRSAESPMEVKAACEVGAEIRKDKADIPAAEEHLLAALDDAPVAAETLGHIRFKRSVDRFSTMLEEQGELKVAAAVVGQAKRALEARGVIQPVVDELADRHERLLAADGGGTTAARRRRGSGGAKEAKAAGETRTAKATRATRATKAVTAAAPARKSAPRRRATR